MNSFLIDPPLQFCSFYVNPGWAIGSLDLIGNPAGFLRSARTGLYDTMYLPYEGLTRGPSAFVSGVASGMSSLVRHLSAGKNYYLFNHSLKKHKYNTAWQETST